jgi:hypothetical protein
MSGSEYQRKVISPTEKQEGLLANTLKAIADDKSLVLFNTIAIEGGDSDILVRRLCLTRKQYYSRISALSKAGLISRNNRRYRVTSFGKIVYDAQLMIGRAANTFWKLKAIDSFDAEHKLPVDERNKIINALIDSQDIKKILVKQS